MRIYYFGKLIEDTNNPAVREEKDCKQTELDFSAAVENKKPSIGMPSIGDLLEDINLDLESYRPLRFQRQL